MRATSFVLLCLLLCSLGCDRSAKATKESAGSERAQVVRQAPAAPEAAEAADFKPARGEKGKDDVKHVPRAGGDQKDAEAREEAPRKIIYTANVNLIVENFEPAVDELTTLIRNNKAFVSSSDVHGQRGVPRSGTWTIRVPQEQFDTLVAAVAKLGEATQNRRDSQDVTEGYYDAKERLKTLEVEEEALRKYYAQKHPTATPAEMMAVHDKLTEFRTQIEQTKGRIKRWDNQVELATLVVNLSERKPYVPPVESNSPVEPSFGQSVGGTFTGSIDALVAVGKGIVTVAVALAPWLGVLAVLGSPLWVHLWRARRARKPIPVAAATPEAPNS